MRNHAQAMAAFVRLARVSCERGQPAGRDRFLVLAAREACSAGWPDIAEVCRRIVVTANPRHLLSRFDSCAAALRSPEQAEFFTRLDQFCTFEQAEHLLTQHGQWPVCEDESEAGTSAASDLEFIRQQVTSDRSPRE